MFRTRRLLAGGAIAAAAMAFGTPAHAQSASEILKGAAIGAGGGAVVGAVVPGVSVGEGALIGAAGGAVFQAIDKKGRRWYRDEDGRKFWVDKRGRRHYRR